MRAMAQAKYGTFGEKFFWDDTSLRHTTDAKAFLAIDKEVFQGPFRIIGYWHWFNTDMLGYD